MYISGALRTVIVFSVFLLVSVSSRVMASSGAAENEDLSFDGMVDQIRAGIENVVHVVSPVYDTRVESFLRSYLEKNREKTEEMIGRSTVFFPIFEQELKANDLPEDLKYLSVIESALTPQAVSPVGAAGLWQFMRPTGRMYGLQISRYVDERCDPVKSTQAAIRYLKDLYTQFNSWELAMAAYNSGPGRVRYAIRRSGSKDYWKLQRYLPRETRSYVPGFIAASYVLNYFHDHGLTPVYPDYDITQTDTVSVYTDLSFTTVQSITGVPREVISFLNPVFVRKYIPSSDKGYDLILPANAAVTMRAYLNSDADHTADIASFGGIETGVEMEYIDKLVEHIYLVESGDNLYNLAHENSCSVADLKAWNKLSGNLIHVGQPLRILKLEKVLVKAVPPPPPMRMHLEVPTLNTSFALATDIWDRRKTAMTALHAEPGMLNSETPSASAVFLRRRLSLHDMGIEPISKDMSLTPGTRVR